MHNGSMGATMLATVCNLVRRWAAVQYGRGLNKVNGTNAAEFAIPWQVRQTTITLQAR